ncbi:MAG: hypothetical protein IJV25_05025 [Prevotella sp.]|nr:hypothetical protein [Prevotella sp.]MBQ9649766.1 hypothetical protein [Prevotella sp.]
MKKSIFLWLITLVLMITGLSSCSNDDGFSDIIGTWYLVSYNNGWGDISTFDEGEITVTFTSDGVVRIVNNREDQSPLPTGTRTYSFKEVGQSIYTGESKPGITFDGYLVYSFDVFEETLHISAEAYDGPGYGFKKAY